jgi:hypothetical protein
LLASLSGKHMPLLSGSTHVAGSQPAQALSDALIDHGGDALGDEIRLVSSEMEAPMVQITAMGAGLGLISRL